MAGRVPNPPAYPPTDSAVLYGDKELYARIGKVAEQVGGKYLVDKFEIPIRSGKAWVVNKGRALGNIAPLLISPARHTALLSPFLHASHVSVGDRLWSNLPYLRPLVTIVADSLKEYGVDEVGGRCHDLLGTRCDPYVDNLLSGDDFDYHCHSNLVRAVLPYGLTEMDIHDVLNVFQVTRLNEDGKYCMEPCPANPGEYFAFFAETDVLCAMSTCPGGDLSVYGWGEDSEQRMLETCRPLAVAVYDIENKEEILMNWKESEPARYKGMHGLKIPIWETKS
ncbi:unnamed protein product [Diplocarpon coronariae]|nr:hypothetical protein JHW43_004037 [Diplocarpon mali]